nr:MAG TPA: hypothetical protein [Caudoviricetes sp.]
MSNNSNFIKLLLSVKEIEIISVVRYIFLQ